MDCEQFFAILEWTPPPALQTGEHRALPSDATAADTPDACWAEIALVNLDLALERAPFLRQIRHPHAKEPAKSKGGVVVQADQLGGTIGCQIQGKKAQKIPELSLRDSPPKQMPVFRGHKSILPCSQNHSAKVDPFPNTPAGGPNLSTSPRAVNEAWSPPTGSMLRLAISPPKPRTSASRATRATSASPSPRGEGMGEGGAADHQMTFRGSCPTHPVSPADQDRR